MGADLEFELLGHATMFVAFRGRRILIDPHLFNTHAFGLAGYFPKRLIEKDRVGGVDAIFISHFHRDHFDIRSIMEFDRKTAVYCPNDPRLNLTLTELGFSEVINIRDWSRLEISPDSMILWTPSEYRVPEHGFAIKVGKIAVWNMVDTIVSSCDVIDRIVAELGVSKLTACFAPLLPLQETAITDGQQPHAQLSGLESILELLKQRPPEILIPFADGHLCANSASWLNSFKFPILHEDVAAIAALHLKETKVQSVPPGETISFYPGGVVTFGQQPNSIAKTVDLIDPRRFNPAGFIPPVSASGANAIRTQLRSAVVRGLDEVARNHFRSIAKRIRPCGLIPTRYRFSTIGLAADVVEDVHCIVHGQGDVQLIEPVENPDVHVVVSTTDLSDLLEGRVSYSALYLNGRIRELHLSATWSENTCILEQPWQSITQGSTGAVVSGIQLLNRILARGGRAWEKQLREEVRQVQRGELGRIKPPLPIDQVNLGTPPLTAVCNEVLDRVEVYLRSNCAMSINGPITSTNESLFLGSLLDARWPKPSKDANGLLLDCSLLEAQPHLGQGVRFPRASYMTLLYNIIQSGIKDWRVVRPRPFNACIPSWRLFSLYPISVSKLIADLRVRRWCGSISMQAFPVETSQWWLGLPKEPELKRVHNASSYIPELDRHLEESSTSLCAKAGRWAVTETLMTGAVRSTYTLPSGCWPLKVVPQQEALHVQRTLAVLNKVLVKKGGR
jgi:hypothetical protein